MSVFFCGRILLASRVRSTKKKLSTCKKRIRDIGNQANSENPFGPKKASRFSCLARQDLRLSFPWKKEEALERAVPVCCFQRDAFLVVVIILCFLENVTTQIVLVGF